MTSVNAYLNHPVKLYADLTFELRAGDAEPETQGTAASAAEVPLSQKVNSGVFTMADGSRVSVDKYGKFVFKPVGGSSIEVGLDPALRSWRLPVVISSMEPWDPKGVSIHVDEPHGTMEARIGERIFSVKQDRGCQPEGCEFTVESHLAQARDGDAEAVTLSRTNAGSFDLQVAKPLQVKGWADFDWSVFKFW